MKRNRGSKHLIVDGERIIYFNDSRKYCSQHELHLLCLNAYYQELVCDRDAYILHNHLLVYRVGV